VARFATSLRRARSCVRDDAREREDDAPRLRLRRASTPRAVASIDASERGERDAPPPPALFDESSRNDAGRAREDRRAP
jgi:hypothetical protein